MERNPNKTEPDESLQSAPPNHAGTEPVTATKALDRHLAPLDANQRPLGRWQRMLRIAAPGPSWGATIFVWGSWALMVFAALANIKENGDTLPIYDDWDKVPYLVGEEPITLDFLWQQEGEHRYPLTKVVYYAMLKLTSGDYRAPAFLVCLILGGLAFVMIRVAKSLRGWTSYTDAFFPLVMLQGAFTDLGYCGGHCAVLYSLTTLVAAGLLAIIAHDGTQVTLGTGILTGIGLILLPLCDASGIVFLVPLACWFGYVGVRAWRFRHTQGRWTGVVVLGGLFAAFIILILYFVGFEKQTVSAPPLSGRWQFLKASLQIASTSFGSKFAEGYWPYSGLAVLILLVISAAVLISAIFRQDGENRARAVGLLFFLGASCMLALAISLGRGGYDAVFFYCLLPLPIVLCLYFVWGLPKLGTMRQFGHACLFGVACFAGWVNISTGFAESRQQHATVASFEEDLRSGVPPYLLIARYGYSFALEGTPYYSHYEPRLRMLQRAGYGPFQNLTNDPPFRQILLSLAPFKAMHAGDDRGTVRFPDDQPYVTLTLPRPMFVACIQVMYSTPKTEYRGGADENLIAISWKRESDPSFPEAPQAAEVWAECLVAIGDRIDQVRIHGYPSRDYKISKVVVLIPDSRPGNAPGG